MKGTLNNYGYDSASRTGSASGLGKLYVWNSGTMQWVLVQSDVSFCIMFVDYNMGGGTGKVKNVVTPDKFGINISYTPTSSQPLIPNYVPQALKGGDISMKDLSALTSGVTTSSGTNSGGKK